MIEFIGAWVRLYWAKLFGYRVLANPLEQQARWRKCRDCPLCKDDVCQKCGCLIYAKISLTTERCPIKTWKRIWAKRVTI